MDGAHCPTCQAYEERVMARKPDEELPATVVPCRDYAMSEPFKAWVVERLRADILQQVSGAGLDRMGIVKSGGRAPKKDQE